jgi:hypothetical protein
MHTLLPWIFVSLSLALMAAAAVLWFFQARAPQQKPLPTQWALTPRPVFTVDERKVYRQLREAMPHHIVLAKLPLVRFCQPVDPQQVRYWFELLGNVNVAFAICSANGRVLAAVDLDADRHSPFRRATQIKQAVLAACKIRYLRCAPDQLPSIPELQLLVPQTGPAARGAAPAPMVGRVRDAQAAASAARRRDRATLWQDSGFLQDSYFGADGRGDLGSSSGFGLPRPGMARRELPDSPADIGGIVVDTPVQQQYRH